MEMATKTAQPVKVDFQSRVGISQIRVRGFPQKRLEGNQCSVCVCGNPVCWNCVPPVAPCGCGPFCECRLEHLCTAFFFCNKNIDLNDRVCLYMRAPASVSAAAVSLVSCELDAPAALPHSRGFAWTCFQLRRSRPSRFSPDPNGQSSSCHLPAPSLPPPLPPAPPPPPPPVVGSTTLSSACRLLLFLAPLIVAVPL